jgi:hypothetical protein
MYLGRRIAQQQLNPVQAVSWSAERVHRIPEHLHPEILHRAIRIDPVQPIEERRNFEQARAILDEVFVDDLRAAQGTAMGLRFHGHDAFFAAEATRSASSDLVISMLRTTRSVRIS